MTTPCGGCMKARRFLINKTPAPIRKRLTQAFLPEGHSPYTELPNSLPLSVTTTPTKVIREARTWLGVPFRHQGRDRNGVDCIGLPIVILQNLGILPAGFELTNYSRFPHQNELEPRILEYCKSLKDVTPGCLVALSRHRTLAHVAIYTDTDTIIHAFERAPHASVIEHGFRGMWRRRFAPTAWALPGVNYG
jgi:cell wall-associated NlpC family hydrolase